MTIPLRGTGPSHSHRHRGAFAKGGEYAAWLGLARRTRQHWAQQARHFRAVLTATQRFSGRTRTLVPTGRNQPQLRIRKVFVLFSQESHQTLGFLA
jgi:hypothetical protein